MFPSQNVFFSLENLQEKNERGKEREDSLRFLIQAGEEAYAKVLVYGYLLSDLGGHKEKITLGSLLKENLVFLINENSLDFKKLSADTKKKYEK